MYHSKVRLEFWVIHFVKQIRRVRYLTTIELKTNFDVSAFLTSDSSLKSLDDVKLVSSQAVFDSTIGVLDMFSYIYNYQANFSVDMHNSFRLVADNFSRDAFEDFKPTESLLKLSKSASKMYKDEQSSLQEVEKSDNKKHVEVLVFKRKADKALDRELQEAGKELAEAETAFVQA